MVKKKVIDFVVKKNTNPKLIIAIKEILRDSVLTYMQTNGTMVGDEIQELLDISDKEMIGCCKFYKMYVEKKEQIWDSLK